ncbi:MAG: formylglycine-generating enzyme family protein [Lentisphaerae bacterium]|nr:formylglycine-generating enzyme family protein [Lentisphaerota bacterium]
MKASTARIGIVALSAAMVTTASAATVEQVVVRQQWPWSTDVRVEYSITGVTSPVDVTVTAFSGNELLSAPNLENAITGERFGISRGGVYSFTIDPVKAFGTGQIAMADFKVRLSLSESAANVGEVLYKIYDLEGGSCTDVTRADLLNGKYGTIETNYTAFTAFDTPVSDILIWTGVTNDAKYATTHLVMRKVPAKNQMFKMGFPSGTQWTNGDETRHNVTLTNDFYMGVFEVTQYQYWKFKNSWPSFYSLEECRDTRPLDKGVTWENIRGAATTVGAEWPDNLSHEVTSGSFLGNLRNALDGAPKIDLPTEAQWEYACRAKSTNDWYNGYDCIYGNDGSSPANLNKIARYAQNHGYGPDGTIIGKSAYAATLGTSNGTARVGSYLPNAFGLYDMTGNVWEWCLDWHASFTSDGQTEPPGPDKADSDSKRVLRGGGITSAAYQTRTAMRISQLPWYTGGSGAIGFRLCLTVTE